jgi:antitoxin ParD1/3/4
MSNAPIVISLEEEIITRYVEARVDSGAYGTPKDFIRDLILDDRDRRLARLEDRLLENMKSKPIQFSDEDLASGSFVDLCRTKLGQVG